MRKLSLFVLLFVLCLVGCSEPTAAVLKSISVNPMPAKTEYFKGESLDLSGMGVKATFTDGTVYDVMEKDYTTVPVSGTVLEESGKTTVTVFVSDKTTTFNVTVRNEKVTEIGIYTKPIKTTYYVGQSVDTSGLVLTVKFDDGTTEYVTKGFTVSPTVFETKGEQDVTVSYGGQTTSYEVTVLEAGISGITVRKNPNRLNYIEGETVDTTGMVLSVNYEDGTTVDVTKGYSISPEVVYMTSTAGTQEEFSIAVYYEGCSTSYKVTIHKSAKSISAITDYAKTTGYYIGDKVDTTGLIIAVEFTDGTKENITSGYTLYPVILTKSGDQIITVKYGGQTTTYTVNVSGYNRTLYAGDGWWKSRLASVRILKADVKKIEFKNTVPSGTPYASWAVDVNGTGCITCYAYATTGGYDLCIVGDTIKANKDFAYFFDLFINLTSIDFGVLDTTGVTNMEGLFSGCLSLVAVDISKLNTSSVTDMQAMFYGCSALASLDLSKFDTSAAQNMKEMFYGCSSLTSLDVSSFDTDKVTAMINMFYGCSGLTELDVSGFDTSAVTDMKGMFYGCSGLTSLIVDDSFDTSDVKDMSLMFYGCEKLRELDLSAFDTSKATTMFSMFRGCTNLKPVDLSSFDTSKVTDMSLMFSGCNSFTSLDFSNFDTSSVTDMDSMFSGCVSLNTITFGSSFTTASVMDMGGMFYGCVNMEGLDVSSFNPSAVVDSANMFSEFGKKDATVTINSTYKSFFDGTALGTADWSYSSGVYTKVGN